MKPSQGRSNDAATAAAAYLEATGDGAWKDAAALVDLVRFGQFLRQRISAGRVALPQPTPSFEEFERQWPPHAAKPPREVVEWHYQQLLESRKHALPFGDYSSEFADVTSFRMLTALPVEEAAARWLEAQDSRYWIRMSARLSGCGPFEAIPSAARQPPKARIIGVVLASDSTAWVLYESPQAVAVSAIEVAPELLFLRRRTNSTWRVDPLAHASGAMRGYACLSVPR